MQEVVLKPNYNSAISPELLEKVSIENEFVFVHDLVIEIGFNLDKSDMYGSPFGNEEGEIEDFLSKFEDMLVKLVDFYTEDFEVVYFTYTDQYAATMWKYENGQLKRSSGWIGDFCQSCNDSDDEDQARDEFVDANYDDLKQGYPSDELLDGLRAALA